MSALGSSIKFTVIAVATGYFFYQFSPSTEQFNATRDIKERQKVLEVMRKASGLDLPDIPSTNSKEK